MTWIGRTYVGDLVAVRYSEDSFGRPDYTDSTEANSSSISTCI